MAKTPSKSPASNVAPSSASQKQTSTPMPRGSDPAGQANSAGASQSANVGVARQGAVGSSQQNGARPSAEQIAQRAYERYQKRGGRDGQDQDDWYAAERELSGKAGGHN